MATLTKNDHTVTTEVATQIVQLKADGYREVVKPKPTRAKKKTASTEVAVLPTLPVFEPEDEVTN